MESRIVILLRKLELGAIPLRRARQMSIRPCPCGSGKPSSWQYDARGIELCRTCPACHQRKMAGYRREVLTNPDYWADEPIEPEDY